MASEKSIHTLKLKTVRGSMQLIAREIGMKIVAIGGQLFLVKLLDPSVFGVFAILSFLLSTAEIFTDIGLNLSIIQKSKTPTKNQLSTILFTKIILAILVVLIFNLISPLLRIIYPQLHIEYTVMLFVISLTILFRPLQTLSTSMLERDLRYKEISVIDLAGMLTYYITAVGLAVMGFGIWSFIWGVVAMSLVEFVITFFYYPFVPSLTFQFKKIREYLEIGKFFQIGLFLSVIRNSIIPIMAGTRLPLREVGLLDWSYNTSSFPRVFIDNIGRVSFSSFARMQNNLDHIGKSVSNGFAILSLITCFIISLTLIFGLESIQYIINEKWIGAFPALCWYIASIFFLNGSGLYGHALLAIGKVKEMVFAGALVTIFEIVVSLLLLQHFGFVGIAFGFFLSSILVFCCSLFLAIKNGIKTDVLSIIGRNILIFSICILLFECLQLILPSGFLHLLIKFGLAFVLYCFVVFIISRNDLKLCLSLITHH